MRCLRCQPRSPQRGEKGLKREAVKNNTEVVPLINYFRFKKNTEVVRVCQEAGTIYILFPKEEVCTGCSQRERERSCRATRTGDESRMNNQA